MVANCDRTCVLLRRVLMAASAFAIGISLSASAQTSSPSRSSNGQGDYSGSALLNTDALLGAAPAPAPSASASLAGSEPSSPEPQYGGGHGNSYPSYPGYESRWSHIAVEGGVGFTIPVGPDTSYSTTALNNGYLSPSEGAGFNINAGAGWMFNKRFGVLLEYTFDKQGMPGNYLNALATASGLAAGSLGGNINTWDFALEPIIYQPFSKKSGAYITGGGGFYRKVTNFTEPVESCYYYCYDVAVTVDHYSSNQGGANIGVGFYRKVFGEDSNARFFAEVRYVWVDSPQATASNYYQGNGTEELIPVSFGIRF